jgi:cytoplasmic iron level regulating protein YaaA (DUF328/UPF0246 family)
MKILFAPSESKSNISNFNPISENSFFLPELYSKRVNAINEYNNFNKNASKELGFGEDRSDIFGRETNKAILRYNGVAFEYLDYNSLDENSQNYIDENLILFSNVFGPIKADDLIPNYTFKQGSKIDNFKIEKFYKDNFSKKLDEYLENEDILDLRAKFYDKYYKPKNFTTLKFIKNNKVVSHWAKAYRGEVVKQLATHKINSIDELMNLELKDLKLKEIIEIKNSKELVFEISS